MNASYARTWAPSARLQGQAIRTIVTLLVVSLGFTFTGCALASRRQTEEWAPALSPTEMTSIHRGPEPLVCSREPSTRGTAPFEAPPSPFRFVHPRVTRFVAQFESGGRSSLGTALSRSRLYVHEMARILREEGLPEQLVHLPLIESGFIPNAVSRAGAVGLWQLLAGTGRHYGLRIDRYVDERRDPLKSTRAAARYLRDLQARFGDWHLSLAAYNSGERAVVRLLARRPNATFWELRESGRLSAETADFVPKFLAAVRIAQDPGAHGFDA